MSKYAKFYVAAAGVLAIFFEALSDGEITPSEWAKIGTAVLVAVGVHQIPNSATVAGDDKGSIDGGGLVIALICFAVGFLCGRVL